MSTDDQLIEILDTGGNSSTFGYLSELNKVRLEYIMQNREENIVLIDTLIRLELKIALAYANKTLKEVLPDGDKSNLVDINKRKIETNVGDKHDSNE